ncbi:transposable element Tcb1 transposase [Trichonephila clavipes]|nr:transposable element Tcb1 transposase [Trichonephila clavipes]
MTPFGMVPSTRKLDCSGMEPGCLSRFNLSSDDNRDHVWRPSGKRLNSAFAFQQNTSSTAAVMVWGGIAYNTRSPLVFIHGPMKAQRYVHDRLQTHVLPLIKRLLGVIFNKTMLCLTSQRSHKTFSALLLPFFGLSDS